MRICDRLGALRGHTSAAEGHAPRLSSDTRDEGRVVRRLITSDCHVGVPYSVFDELPVRYREYFPRLEQRIDGEYLLAPAGDSMMGGRGADGDRKVVGDEAVRVAVGACDEARPSFEPEAVLADLERDGVYGAVLIGRISGRHDLMPIEADIAYCEIVNDWMAEHWRPYLDRVAPGIVLPYRDVKACVRELERCAAMGMRPALLPDGYGDLPYHRTEWEPFWEAAHGLRVPVSMHVGGTRLPAGGAGGGRVADGRGAGAPAAAASRRAIASRRRGRVWAGHDWLRPLDGPDAVVRTAGNVGGSG